MLWMIREKSNSMAFVVYEWGLMNECGALFQLRAASVK